MRDSGIKFVFVQSSGFTDNFWAGAIKAEGVAIDREPISFDRWAQQNAAAFR